MAAESEREQLLGLVRSLGERIRLDSRAGHPLRYLGGKALPQTDGDCPAQREPVAERSGERQGGLTDLQSAMASCHRCSLARTRHRLVFGEGSDRAALVFVGEAPGADEDAQGRPFVGRAGQLLTRIIAAMGLTREEVYICNILKCRPPGNRNPLPEEIAACEPFLIGQLQAIGPQVICALGTFAAQTLLKTDAPISALRGGFHLYQGIPLMPTYHPAYLLRNPGAKKLVWEDVQRVMKRLRGEG